MGEKKSRAVAVWMIDAVEDSILYDESFLLTPASPTHPADGLGIASSPAF
jgi:hypothetical protein